MTEKKKRRTWASLVGAATRRQLWAYLAAALWMAVTTPRVALYAATFEREGSRALGWAYALALDVGVLVCMRLTGNQFTERLAWAGYGVGVAAAALMNAAHVRPWERTGWDAVGAWTYTVAPLAAQSALGFVARAAMGGRRRVDADEEKKELRSKLREVRRELAVAEQEVKEVRAGRDLEPVTRASFDAFRASRDGEGEGMSTADWNRALRAAGMEYVSEGTLRGWLRED